MSRKILLMIILSLFCVFNLTAGGRQEDAGEIENPGPANGEPPVIYDPDDDLFPYKLSVEYAEGFTLEYKGSYKLVTVMKPYPGAAEGFTYILLQKGAPVPEGYSDATVINVPVESFVSMSTTYIGVLKMLGVENTLTGVDSAKYIYDPGIRKLAADYRILEVSNEYEPNIEVLLDLDPDIIMTSAMGNKWDVHPKMMEVNLPVVINGEWNEADPLGRAEWIKFISLFFNREEEADLLFNSIEQQYIMLRDAVENYTEERPTVFTGAPYGDSWDVPGGKSYLADLLEDAGSDYIWKDTVTSGSIPVSFETVFYKAGEAGFWLNAGWNWQSMEELESFDERLMSFNAFNTGNVYANTGRINEDGGNDYWESGVANPHVLLADLIKILHPELLPEHELVYYRNLK